MPKKVTKKEMKELDDAWKKHVKERDKHTCQICNKKIEGKNCHAHHIIPRQVRTLRWDINNGITLCYPHHKVGIHSPHMNALWFYCWFKSTKLSQFRYIIKKLKKLEE